MQSLAWRLGCRRAPPGRCPCPRRVYWPPWTEGQGGEWREGGGVRMATGGSLIPPCPSLSHLPEGVPDDAQGAKAEEDGGPAQ